VSITQQSPDGFANGRMPCYLNMVLKEVARARWELKLAMVENNSCLINGGKQIIWIRHKVISRPVKHMRARRGSGDHSKCS